jgi:hypothetical protein
MPSPAGNDPLHRRSPQRQRAGLVQQDGARLAEALDYSSALDEHARAGGPRDAGDQRDRGGEDQRARRRHHQDRDGAHRIAADQPRRRGSHRQRQEDKYVAVGGRTKGARSVSAFWTSDTSAPYALSPAGRLARSSKAFPAFVGPLRTGSPGR